MAHDVFISHSSRDKTVSDAVCAALEQAGIRCWIAPRDVQPGRSFAGEITRAIQQGKAMVLIFSAHSNTSEQVLREVQLAVEAKLHILQFRIEEVLLNDDLKYYLSTPHWLDALSPPLENHLDRLGHSLQTLLGKAEPVAAISTAPAITKESEAKPPSITPVVAATSPPRRNLIIPSLITAALVGALILAVALLRPDSASTDASSPTTTPHPPSATSPSAHPAGASFERTWDFAGGTPRDVRTDAVEVVDAKIWKKSGGEHFRFLTGGRSSLEVTFDIPDQATLPTRLTVWHLSSSPDGTRPGFSPVRITLNGNEIFRGSPPESGWSEEQIGLGRYVQAGRNNLRWEFLDGAQTHYWLKSFRISGGG